MLRNHGLHPRSGDGRTCKPRRRNVRPASTSASDSSQDVASSTLSLATTAAGADAVSLVQTETQMKVEHVVIKQEPALSGYDLFSPSSTAPNTITASAVQEAPADREIDAQVTDTTDQNVVIKVEPGIIINEPPSPNPQEPSEQQVPAHAGDMFAEFCTPDLFDEFVATTSSQSS
jgi:hypothetical protein